MKHTSSFRVHSILAVLCLLSPADGALQVHLRESFDGGSLPKFWSGSVTGDSPYKGSAGCVTPKILKGNQYFGMALRYDPNKDFFTIADDTLIYFAYFTDKSSDLKIQMSSSAGQIFTHVRKLTTGKWTTITLPMKSFQTGYGKDKKSVPIGTTVDSFAVFAAAPDTSFNLKIDEFSITTGGLPTDIAAQIAKGEAYVKATSGQIRTHGYRISPGIVKNLVEKTKGKSVTARKFMVFGSSTAASQFFITPLRKKELTAARGYKIARAAAMGRKTAAWGAKQAQLRLKREKPEVAFIMLLETEYANPRTNIAAVEPDLARLVSICLSSGTVPILFRLPKREPSMGPGMQRYIAVNSIIDRIAKSAQVPLIDPAKILHTEDRKALRKLWRSKKPTRMAYDKINAVALNLYRVLEAHVFGRAPKAAEDPEAVAAEDDDEPAPKTTAPKKKRKTLFDEDAEFNDE